MTDFLQAICGLKNIPRSGWICHGVSLQDVESVADHTFSTCALSAALAELETKMGNRVKVETVLKMALFHDLAEVLTFDISKAYLEYLGPRGQRIKNEVEAAATKQLGSALRPFGLSGNYAKLSEEYAVGKTIESRIVHAADGLDILLQVLNLRRRGYPEATLRDLWNMTMKKLESSDLSSTKKILNGIRSELRRLR